MSELLNLLTQADQQLDSIGLPNLWSIFWALLVLFAGRWLANRTRVWFRQAESRVDMTINMWIKTTQSDEGELVAANDSASAHPFMLGIQTGSPYVNDGSDTQFPSVINDDQWHMLTYIRSGNTGHIYVDGLQRGTYSSSFSLDTITRWSIGQEWDAAGTTNPSDFYTGAVDDVRFYDYSLSNAEVAWLIGRTEPFDKPF